MKMQIHTEGVTLNNRDEQYIGKKIANLKKYCQRLADESVIVRIDVRKDLVKTSTKNIVVHVTISLPKAIIRAEISGYTLQEAVDLVMGKIKKQLERYKDKMGKGKIVDVPQEFRSLSKIAKRKFFSHVIPMSEDEAIEQMEMLNHDFYIFVNEKTRLYNVLYKRAKGGYGLIELGTKENVA